MNNWTTKNDGTTWHKTVASTRYLLTREGQAWHLRALRHDKRTNKFELLAFPEYEAPGADVCVALELADVVVENASA